MRSTRRSTYCVVRMFDLDVKIRASYRVFVRKFVHRRISYGNRKLKSRKQSVRGNLHVA